MRIPILSIPVALSLALLSCTKHWMTGATEPGVPHYYAGSEILLFDTEELQEAVVYAPYLPALRRIILQLDADDSKVPEALHAFQQVTQLEIWGVGADCSLQALSKMPQLQVLRIQSVFGRQNLNYITALKRLGELHLIGCRLANLPFEQSNWANLEVLDLSGNRFTLEYYVEELMQLSKLRALRMDGNPIEWLPHRLFEHQRLEYLSFDGCKIVGIKGDVGYNKVLKEIYLGNNFLSALPIESVDFPNLKRLSMPNNKITALPPIVVSNIKFMWVNFRKNGLKTLPKSWLEYPLLSYLDVGENEMDSLPTLGAQGSCIGYLNLDQNAFDRVPNCIVQMKELNALSMWDNFTMQSIPLFVKNHSNLSQFEEKTNPYGFFASARTFDRADWKWQLLDSYSVLASSPMHVFDLREK